MTPTERLRLAVPPGRGYIVQVQSDDLAALLDELDRARAVVEAARKWVWLYGPADSISLLGQRLANALAAYDRAVSKP